MTESRKLAAILVADVVGFSPLAGADEDRTPARLRVQPRGDIDAVSHQVAVREGVAKPGSIYLSERRLSPGEGELDLAVSDLGQTQLKNIAEPVRVYSLQVGSPSPPVDAKTTATLALPDEVIE